MSILGLGTDIVAVGRVADLLARHGDRFLQRCFTTPEREAAVARRAAARAAAVAARWAAKEAFLKAVGGAIGHIAYHDVSVVNDGDGAPQLVLTGAADAALRRRGGRRIHVSLSHEREYAVATVVIED